MSDFTPIDGNPAETVGTTRIDSAEESDEAIRLRTFPRGILEVLSDHLASHHVLIALFVGLALETLVAIVAESAFPRADLTWVFVGFAAVVLVVCSGLYFVVVHSDSDGDGRSSGPAVLTIRADTFEVTTDGWFGSRTRLEGEAWTLLKMLRRLDRGRIALSTEVMAALRPTGTLRSFLVTGLTERDRAWLLRQLEAEG